MANYIMCPGCYTTTLAGHPMQHKPGCDIASPSTDQWRGELQAALTTDTAPGFSSAVRCEKHPRYVTTPFCPDCRTEEELARAGALGVQIGGKHYKDLAIQPIEYIHKKRHRLCRRQRHQVRQPLARKGRRAGFEEGPPLSGPADRNGRKDIK